MARNVEIKAIVRDWEAVVQAAERLSDTSKEIILQEDIFYPSPKGRIKLRILAPEHGELIYYERPDQEGPKTSTYFITRTSEPQKLNDVLTYTYGQRGIVQKERWLFLVGPTRIHLDQVEGLGTRVDSRSA